MLTHVRPAAHFLLRSTKAGMTQVFGSDGNAYPATVIALESGNIVTAVKTVEKDGYAAVQVRGPCCLFLGLCAQLFTYRAAEYWGLQRNAGGRGCLASAAAQVQGWLQAEC